MSRLKNVDKCHLISSYRLYDQRHNFLILLWLCKIVFLSKSEKNYISIESLYWSSYSVGIVGETRCPTLKFTKCPKCLTKLIVYSYSWDLHFSYLIYFYHLNFHILQLVIDTYFYFFKKYLILETNKRRKKYLRKVLQIHSAKFDSCHLTWI